MHATTNSNGHASPYTLLWTYLQASNYTPWAIETILDHVDREGTLEGCPCLEPEDREAAEGWLETGYPAVPMTSHAWDEESWSDCGPSYWPVGDALLCDIWECVHQKTMGQGPDEPPYEPSAADLAEMAEWSAALGEGMEFPREMTALERREAAAEIVRWWVEHETD